MTEQEKLQLVIPIMQGLLASGHYTGSDENKNNEPFVYHEDYGKDWKLAGHHRREVQKVIPDAVELLEDMVTYLEHLKELDSDA